VPLTTITPNATGTNNAGTPTGAAANWQCVATDNAETSYTLMTNAVNGECTCACDDPAEPTAAGAINSITANVKCRLETGTPALKPCLYLPGVGDWQGSSQTMTASYATYSETRLVRPVTGAPWVVADVAAVEVGWFSSATVNRRFTYVTGTVDWTAAPGFWACLVTGLFGSLVGIGMQHAAGLAREISLRRRSLGILASEHSEMIREIREGRYARHFFLGANA
jgi:hypothetical protein